MNIEQFNTIIKEAEALIMWRALSDINERQGGSRFTFEPQKWDSFIKAMKDCDITAGEFDTFMSYVLNQGPIERAYQELMHERFKARDDLKISFGLTTPDNK